LPLDVGLHDRRFAVLVLIVELDCKLVNVRVMFVVDISRYVIGGQFVVKLT